MAVRTPKKTRRRKKITAPSQRKKTRFSKTKKKSKYMYLVESGLIGSLNGTGITSKNYKDIIYNRVKNPK